MLKDLLKHILAIGLLVVPVLSAAPVADFDAEMRAIFASINAKSQGAEPLTEKILAKELAQVDALAATYPDHAADALFGRAMIYAKGLGNVEAATALCVELKAKYPGTRWAKAADNLALSLKPGAATKPAPEAPRADYADLIGKPAPEIAFTWSTRAGLTNLASLRGNVVVLDFWATWCGPCVATFPQTRADVACFKDAPVVFLGVTSLWGRVHGLEAKPINTQGDPEKEHALTREFAQKHEMTWDIAFSRGSAYDPAYRVGSIPYVAIIAPDGSLRHAGLHPGLETSDIAGKVTAILKEFGLEAPKK